MQTAGKRVQRRISTVCLPRGVPCIGDLHWRTDASASVLSPGLVTCYVALLRARALTGALVREARPSEVRSKVLLL